MGDRVPDDGAAPKCLRYISSVRRQPIPWTLAMQRRCPGLRDRQGTAVAHRLVWPKVNLFRVYKVLPCQFQRNRAPLPNIAAMLANVGW